MRAPCHSAEEEPRKDGEVMAGKVMTIGELAEYLGAHRSTIYSLVRAGKLPAFKIGSDWRFNRESIDEWRRKQEQANKTT